MNSTTKLNIMRTTVAILIALGISFLIIFVVSDQPFAAISTLLLGPLQKARNFSNVIELMIPLMFTGVGVCIMFTANQINLGGEGAFHIGGLVATAVALNFILPKGIHPMFAILLAGMAGSIITLIPALMKVKTTANELVSSLMMNYLVLYISNFILMKFLRDPKMGSGSYAIVGNSKLTVLFSGTRIHTGLIIAFLVVAFGYWFLYKTKIGYELRLTGENEKFAKYSGVNIVKVVLISQLLGGFIAGMGGGVEMLSPMFNRFTWTALLGYGWDAIIISTLSKKNPLYIPLSAFFLAYLRVGAFLMSSSSDVPVEIISIVQGVIIVLIVAEQFLSKYRHKVIAKEAKSSLNIKEAK